MRPLQNPRNQYSDLLEQKQIYPYQGTKKRDPVFENNKTATEKKNKPLVRQIILGEWLYSQ